MATETMHPAMNAHLLTEGVSTANPADSGKISRKRLRERAVELAVLDGRAPQDAGKSDWEQAKHELIGVTELESGEPSANDSQNESNPTVSINTQTPGWLS